MERKQENGFEQIPNGIDIQVWNPKATFQTEAEQEAHTAQLAELSNLYRNHDETQDYSERDPLAILKDSQARSLLCISAHRNGKMVAAGIAGLMEFFPTAPEDQQYGVIQISHAVTDTQERGKGHMRSILETILTQTPQSFIKEVQATFEPNEEDDVTLETIEAHLQTPAFTIETYNPQPGSEDEVKYAGSHALQHVFAEEAIKAGYNLNSSASFKMTGPFNQLELNYIEGGFIIVNKFSAHVEQFPIINSQGTIIAEVPARSITESETQITIPEPINFVERVNTALTEKGMEFTDVDDAGAFIAGPNIQNEIEEILQATTHICNDEGVQPVLLSQEPEVIRLVASK